MILTLLCWNTMAVLADSQITTVAMAHEALLTLCPRILVLARILLVAGAGRSRSC